MLVARMLPGKWRHDSQAQEYLEKFARDFLVVFFKRCRKVQCVRTRVVTRDVARMALVSMGWSQKMETCNPDFDVSRGWVTKQSLNKFLREKKVSVRADVKLMLLEVVSNVLFCMTKYAKVLRKPVQTQPSDVIRSLRRRAIAEDE